MNQSNAAVSPLEDPYAAAPGSEAHLPPSNQFIVGIGASAGGLPALQNFFDHMPAASGMAFVVIVHLPPDHKSSLPAILKKHTSMQVLTVTETVRVEPNHVYVIPPTKHLAMQDGLIQLSEPDQPRGRRVPIDLFFRTLAETHGSQAVAIVLSGLGADGTLGLTRVKELGGLTLVQEPSEAEYPDMPQSAIATSLVDFVLPVAQMPQQLITYQQHPNIGAVSLDGNRNADEEALRDIMVILRARTGHDFSNYKRSTLLRRIARRLAVRHLGGISDYPAVLRSQPNEIQALLRDFLISVTNFFRDPAAFAALEGIIPQLFVDKGAEDQVRVWVAGCASGDEAYSVAMLLAEHAAQLGQPPGIQVFATDIDEDAITLAREGLYVETIANDLPPERLQRFFTPELGRYRINKEIRDMVLFAVHNILRDPPFSKVDLISCRNLLIYLNRDAQQHVLSLFHFALCPQGYLFLGSAETADGVEKLFTTINKQQHLFQRRFAGSVPPPLPALPVASPQHNSRAEVRAANVEQRHSLHELHQALLAPYAPPSVLINEAYDIVHFSSRATRWLEFSGEPSFNLLRVAHPGLRLELRSALLGATQEHKRAEVRRLDVREPDAVHQINLRVHPLHTPDWAKGLTLVIFEEVQTADAAAVPAHSDNDNDALQWQLEAENQRLKEQLRATIEQYETSLEELKATNEELQSTAEEYRAATEELETSKEELQSVNEELTTVNAELKHKVDEVSDSNNDLHNLLVATDIGTLFLDRALYIKRYTPRVLELFNIIPTDLNRPLAHITHKLDYDHVAQDAAQVLERLMPIEREVRNRDGQWYLMRVLPYRTLRDKIDGVVLTFIEITARKQTEEELRRNDERFRLLYEHVRDYAIFSIDTEGRLRDWNAGAERIFGYAPVEIIGQSIRVLFTPEDVAAGEYKHELQRAAANGSTDDERWHMRRGGERFYVSGVTTALYDQAGIVRGFLKIGRDMTERKQVEEQLHQEYAALEQRVAERTAKLSTLNANLEREMAERRRVETEREQVLRQLMTVQEEERRRISRDLHDQMGQEISALGLALKALEDAGISTPQTRGHLSRAQGLANRISLELHQLALQLRPTALDDLGLEEALTNYAEEWAKQARVELDTHIHGLDGRRLPIPIATTAFRVVQEALTNVLKHAGARSVSVIVERRAHELIITVEDDGRGFDVEATLAKATAENRLGLIGMRERVALVGGTLTFDSTPGRGTTVLVRIPIAKQVGEDADDG
jgi:two-component system, chemotaxis family, CheB/CheR fusion protein